MYIKKIEWFWTLGSMIGVLGKDIIENVFFFLKSKFKPFPRLIFIFILIKRYIFWKNIVSTNARKEGLYKCPHDIPFGNIAK
jgi:hypothetical protein